MSDENSYLLIPADEEVVDEIIGLGVQGFIVDEDLGNSDLEVIISDLDTKLKEAGIRNHYDILAKSSRLRHSADAFKLILLGADAVIMPYYILEKAIGEGNKGNLKEKAFSLIAGMKKEIALLAGAAGVYSVQSTLTGNRELLRSINLNYDIRRRLRVKPAGSL